MMETAAPVFAPGKICYIGMPARDIAASARFYQSAFGWNIRQRGDGATSFDDTVGQVSGVWVTNLRPANDPGMHIYIMVGRIEEAIDAVERSGGTIVERNGAESGEIWALFRDPAGNLLGVYQQPGLAESMAND